MNKLINSIKHINLEILLNNDFYKKFLINLLIKFSFQLLNKKKNINNTKYFLFMFI